MTRLPVAPERTIFHPVLRATMVTGTYAVADTVDKFRNSYPAQTADIAIDIETPGLARSFEINCLTASWYTENGTIASVLLDPARNPHDHATARALIGHARRLILHNAPFDIPPLYHHKLVTMTDINRVVDTLLLARLALPDTFTKKSLGVLAERYLGLTEFKGGMERAFKAAGYATIAAGYEGMDIDSPIYRIGAMADTVATLELEAVLRDRAREWTLDHSFPSVGATTPSEADDIIDTQETVHRVMMRRSAAGIRVDTDYLDVYAERVDSKRVVAAAALATVGLEGGTGKGAKLVEYLDSIGELPGDWPRTPTGKLRATKADLDAFDHPLAAYQREMAETEKVMGYLDKVARQARVTGRCHPQVGTLAASATGRMAYSMPELQQFPADARPVLGDDGHGLTSVDWSQIEPVTMALMAKDEKFLAPFEAGEDLYAPLMLAAGIDRTRAKVLLLSTMYGAGIRKIAAQIGHTEESAQQIKRQMLSAMPGCARWMAGIQSIAEQHGRVITAGGRILPVDAGGVFKAVNYTVQGSAYDVMAHTICKMEGQGLGDHIYLTMHDEVVVDTRVAHEVQQIMVTPPPFLVKWAGRMPTLRTDREDMGAAWAKV